MATHDIYALDPQQITDAYVKAYGMPAHAVQAVVRDTATRQELHAIADAAGVAADQLIAEADRGRWLQTLDAEAVPEQLQATYEPNGDLPGHVLLWGHRDTDTLRADVAALGITGDDTHVTYTLPSGADLRLPTVTVELAAAFALITAEVPDEPSVSLTGVRQALRAAADAVSRGAVAPDTRETWDGELLAVWVATETRDVHELTDDQLDGLLDPGGYAGDLDLLQQLHDDAVDTLVRRNIPELLHRHDHAAALAAWLSTHPQTTDDPDQTNVDGLTARIALPDSDGTWTTTLHPRDGHTTLSYRDISGDRDAIQGHVNRANTLSRMLELGMTFFQARDASQLQLTSDHVITLLGLTDELATAGIQLELPAKLRVASHTSTSAQLEAAGDGSLNLDVLYQLRPTVTIDGRTLTPAEIDELAASHSPLTADSDGWVLISDRDHAAVRAAADLARQTGKLTRAHTLGLALASTLGSDDASFTVTLSDPVAELVAATQVDLTSQPDLDGIALELRDHQTVGAAWLQQMTANGLGVLLADEMGLGKTVQAITLIRHRSKTAARPALVVAPLAVRDNWAEEIARFAPGLDVHVHHGIDRSTSDAVSCPPGTVVITTYETLARDQDELSAEPWDVVVLDETQKIKNPAAGMSRAVRTLEADARLAMTGTPLENRAGDAWAVCEFLNPGMLGTQASFHQLFGQPIAAGDRVAAAALHRILGSIMLQRTKSGAQLGLPPRTIVDEPCGLTEEQIGLYHAFASRIGQDSDGDGNERRMNVLAAIARLKQTCDHPMLPPTDNPDTSVADRSAKLERTVELVREALAGGEKTLVFTQYAKMVPHVAARLAETCDTAVATITGSDSPGRRSRTTAAFRDPDGPGVLVCSLKSCGVGLNLTEASRVIHYDLWWNPAVEDQATDRAHRIGQTREVTVHRLICTDTLEERIDAMLGRKRELAAKIITGVGLETEISRLDDDALRAFCAYTPTHDQTKDVA